MTATDQDRHAERAIAYLAREVRKVCPPSLLADPTKWAADRIAAMRVEHWRCMPPDPKLTRALGSGDGAPPEELADDLEAVRQACEVASDKHHSREG